MNTLILRTTAPYLAAVLALFSVFILLRGHNEPGGGFIGGLIAASALALHGIACGVPAVRRALRFHPLAIAAFGVSLAALSGLAALALGRPFQTGLWWEPRIFGTPIALSTATTFDIGIYLAVVGTVTAIALGLEAEEVS